jgi:hypothetical protein
MATDIIPTTEILKRRNQPCRSFSVRPKDQGTE